MWEVRKGGRQQDTPSQGPSTPPAPWAGLATPALARPELSWRRAEQGLEQPGSKGAQNRPPLATGRGAGYAVGCAGSPGDRLGDRPPEEAGAGYQEIEFPCYFQTSSLDSLPWQRFSCNGFSRRDRPGAGTADMPPAHLVPTSPQLLPGQGRGCREVDAGPGRCPTPPTQDQHSGLPWPDPLPPHWEPCCNPTAGAL